MSSTLHSTSDLTADKLFNVNGMVALVTGGGTGIGLMIAQGLAANGAKVYVGGRREEVLKETAEKHGKGAKGQIVPIALDVSSKESIQAAIVKIQDLDGKLHILVNNAGQAGPSQEFMRDKSSKELQNPSAFGKALFESTGPDDWAALFKINVFAHYYTTSAFLDLLVKGTESIKGYSANVINIVSVSGMLKHSQGQFPYNTSKAAAIHLTTMMSAELAHHNIKVRVNGIAPGLFPAEMTGQQGEQFDEEAQKEATQAIVSAPAGRGGQDNEMAATALYLASFGGCFTNGQVIIVDGGLTTVNPAATR